MHEDCVLVAVVHYINASLGSGMRLCPADVKLRAEPLDAEMSREAG